MNKSVGVGAIVAVIIGIIIVSAAVSMNSTSVEDLGPELIQEEPSPVEETETEVEKAGRDLSVEFTESIGLKSP